MDEDQKQQNIIDEALFVTPEEVKDFMWSDLYEIIIDSIKEGLKLTDAQSDLVKQAGYDLLMELKTVPEVGEEFIKSGMSVDLTAKVLYAMNEEILTRAQNINEFYTPDDTENVLPIATPQAPSPIQALVSIKERLSQPTTIAPSKRDYSLDKPSAPTNLPVGPETPLPPPRTGPDIYRETPSE